MASVKKIKKTKKHLSSYTAGSSGRLRATSTTLCETSMQENRPAGNLSMRMSAVRTDTNEHREQEFILRKKILYLCKSCKSADAESH